jgi:N-acetylglucosamine kinase-like BadF-type ATPase
MLGLGFDSGGTRTTFAVDRGGGPERQSGTEAAVSLSSARGEASTTAAIDWMTHVILDQEDDEIAVWIGAAGFSASTAQSIKEHFARPVREIAARMEQTGRRCDVFIANDAISILKAPPLMGVGLAAIIGTGSVVLGYHPSCPEGVVKRGGFEWLVSDEGAAVWMTLECVRRLLRDIQERGSQDYNSVLLERLADYLSLSFEETHHIPQSHRALAKADLIARRISEPRADAKRFLANFAYPHIFDMAVLDAGAPHDPIAAEVLNDSVREIAEHVRMVSDALAAHTADEPNLREKLPLVAGGNLAANSTYARLLRNAISERCRFVDSVTTIGDAADELAALSVRYLEADAKERSNITRSLDPLHPVLRLL